MTLHLSLPSRPDWTGLWECYGTAGLLLSVPLEEAARRFRGRAAYIAAPIPAFDLVEGPTGARRIYDRVIRRLVSRCVLDCAEHGLTAVSPFMMLGAAMDADCRGRVEDLDPRFLQGWCEPLIREARLVLVPMVTGWDADRDVWAQAQVALAHNIHVVLLEAR